MFQTYESKVRRPIHISTSSSNEIATQINKCPGGGLVHTTSLEIFLSIHLFLLEVMLRGIFNRLHIHYICVSKSKRGLNMNHLIKNKVLQADRINVLTLGAVQIIRDTFWQFSDLSSPSTLCDISLVFNNCFLRLLGTEVSEV